MTSVKVLALPKNQSCVADAQMKLYTKLCYAGTVCDIYIFKQENM